MARSFRLGGIPTGVGMELVFPASGLKGMRRGVGLRSRGVEGPGIGEGIRDEDWPRRWRGLSSRCSGQGKAPSSRATRRGVRNASRGQRTDEVRTAGIRNSGSGSAAGSRKPFHEARPFRGVRLRRSPPTCLDQKMVSRQSSAPIQGERTRPKSCVMTWFWTRSCTAA